MASEVWGNGARGYVVKLYKKVASESQKATIQDAMFMTWTNFDCMDVLPISSFRGFGRRLMDNELKEREKYDSRQKLFLYPVGTDQRLLSDDESELAGYPLIMLTVLDLKSHSGMKWASYRSILSQSLAKCIKKESNIKGQLYGCLSIYDYALVMRGSSYKGLVRVLAAYRKMLIESGIYFRRAYTIAGLDLKHCSAWQEPSPLRVSVRLSCTSQMATEYFTENENIKKALQPGYQAFSIFGKYDYDIVGDIRDTNEFVNLFFKDGALSPARAGIGIQKTNTRFMLEENWETSSVPDPSGKPSHSTEEELKEFIWRSKNLGLLCPSIRESLLRLVLRLFQACSTISDEKMRGSLRDTLSYFLDFLKLHQEEGDQQDTFARMINCFNLLLDNRVTASMSDFETPQNVLRYSGANLKVLLAYALYVDKLIGVLQFYKDQRNEHLRYVPLVTTDTGAKITATIFLSGCERFRFININIPVDLLFEVQNVLPWLTHEVGHFIRAGWSRENRNAAYFWSMSRVATKMLDAYIANEYTQSSDNSAMAAFLMAPVPERQGGMKFDQYRDSVCQYYQSIFLRCTYEYNSKLQIPQSHTGVLMASLEEIAAILQKVFEEAIADIFMIRILEIKDLIEYLQIQNAYYQHVKQSLRHLPLENISRIVAVSIIIQKWDQQDYEGIKDNFSRIYDQYKNDQMEPMLDQLKEYEDYYMIEPLVLFLNKYVESGLECLLQEEQIINVCKYLRKHYKSLRTGNFDAFLDFIDSEKTCDYI